MDFWIELVQTVVKMILLGAVGYGGIICGKALRKRKNAKRTVEAEN